MRSRVVGLVDPVNTRSGAIQPRHRVLFLLAAFTTLRFGELASLRRRRPARRLPRRTRPRARSPPGALRRCRAGRPRVPGSPRRSNFRDDWTATRATAGVSGDVHFHDLRHTGNTLASSAGASTRELMTRMGHSTTRAALSTST
ncbi:tyrosine-type recombinase/integrase [Streptomyces zaomyceticus]|uniref:tyrosine-type recombinase/integrase n=1 Tax=Streptomyces zaomyceticus TaxID=68286 RepID=UPI0036AF3D72